MTLSKDDLLNSVPTVNEMPTSGVSPREIFILTRIDGRTNLKDIVRISGMNENEVLAIVEILSVRGIISLGGVQGAPSAPALQPQAPAPQPRPVAPQAAAPQEAFSALSQEDIVFVNTSANIGKGSGITPRQAFLLSRITSKMRVKEVCQVTGIAQTELFSLLSKLAEKGIIQVDSASHGGPPRAAPRPVAPAPAPAQPQPPEPAPAQPPTPAPESGPTMAIEGEPATQPVAPPPPPQPLPPEAFEQPLAPPPQVMPPSRSTEAHERPPPQRREAPARIVAPIRDRKEPKDYGKPTEKGDLSVKLFPMMLAELAMETKTGVLRVIRNDGGGYKDIFIKAGFPAIVESHVLVEKECLGRLLKFAGKITDYDLDRSIEEMMKTKKRQGEILLEMGCLTHRDLDVALRWQTEIKLQDIFTWPGGTYEFYQMTTLDVVPSKIILPAFIHKGIRRSLPMSMVQKVINNNLKNYPSKEAKQPFRPEDFNFQPLERKLFEEGIDGSKPLADVLEEVQFDKQVAMKVFVSLYATGMIKFRDTRAATSREAKMLQELKERASVSEKGNYFDMLGIHWGCVTRKVEEAYNKIIDIYGPKGKLMKELGPEAKEYCNTIILKAEEARNFLVSEQNRRDYRLKIYDKSKMEISADLQLRQAETQLIWKEDYQGALDNLESAADINPKSGLIQAALGAAIVGRFKGKEKEKVQEGMKKIQRALSMAPNNDMVHFYAGLAYVTAGRMGQARTAFETATRLNPANKDARRYLARID